MESTEKISIIGLFRDYFKEFGKLKACSRNFWTVQWINLLDGVAYFAMLPALTLYLSDHLGMNDVSAGNWYGILMAIYTGMGFIAGFIGDSLGIKRTLHLSIIILVVSRITISFTTSEYVVVPALMAIMVGTAIMTPILIAATKRYTTKGTRAAGFNFLYFLWNIGVIIAGPALDFVRDTEWGTRGVFLLGSAMSLICWVSIIFLRRKTIDEADEESKEEEEKRENPIEIAISVFTETAFWRFMLFLVLVVGVKMVFEHWHAISPKYYLRVIGPDAPVGVLNSLNGWVICIGLIISTPIVARFKLFNVMLFGICISAISVFIPVIPPSLFCENTPEALAQGYYILIIAQIVLFSIGEVIWSPRLYEYTAAIAPKGREASYMGLSAFPMFFARMLEGPLSGNLLAKYCPEGTTSQIAAETPFMQSPQFMWLILAGIAVASPILIVLLRGVIQKEAKEDL